MEAGHDEARGAVRRSGSHGGRRGSARRRPGRGGPAGKVGSPAARSARATDRLGAQEGSEAAAPVRRGPNRTGRPGEPGCRARPTDGRACCGRTGCGRPGCRRAGAEADGRQRGAEADSREDRRRREACRSEARGPSARRSHEALGSEVGPDRDRTRICSTVGCPASEVPSRHPRVGRRARFLTCRPMV